MTSLCRYSVVVFFYISFVSKCCSYCGIEYLFIAGIVVCEFMITILSDWLCDVAAFLSQLCLTTFVY